MKRLLLLGCISSLYCSQPYMRVLLESIRERSVTNYMIEERSKVIHRRMISIYPYLQGDSVPLNLWNEYQRLEREKNIVMNVLDNLKEVPLKGIDGK